MLYIFPCFIFYLPRYDHLWSAAISLPEVSLNKQHMCNKSTKLPFSLPSLMESDAVSFKAPVFPSEPTDGPKYRFRSHVEEYNFITNNSDIWTVAGSSSESHRPEGHVRFDDMIDWSTVRVVLLVVDALLLLYRFCIVYMYTKSVSQSNSKLFTVSASSIISKPHEAQVPSIGYGTSHSSYSMRSNRHGTSQDRSMLLNSTAPPVGTPRNQNNGYASAAGKVAAQPELVKKANQSDCSLLTDAFLQPLQKLFLSRTLPKVLIACAILLLLYVYTSFIVYYSDKSNFSKLGLLDVFISGLQSQIKQMNWYLTAQATYFNNVSMAIYRNQMISELKQLQNVLTYFADGKSFCH